MLSDIPMVYLGLLGSGAAGLATGVGALPIFLFNRITQATQGDALRISLLTGLVEPLGGTLRALSVSIFRPVLPIAMGFAAGAMLFVISDEIIPESHRLGHEKAATAGLMVGFVLKLFLDVTLG